MAITQDGTQAFGINTSTFDSFVVESFSKNFTSNRVDIDNGDGEPLGTVIVPGRTEFSLTVQVGSGNSTPTIGQEVVYANDVIVVTDVSEEESQADYRRLSISGYKKIN